MYIYIYIFYIYIYTYYQYVPMISWKNTVYNLYPQDISRIENQRSSPPASVSRSRGAPNTWQWAAEWRPPTCGGQNFFAKICGTHRKNRSLYMSYIWPMYVLYMAYIWPIYSLYMAHIWPMYCPYPIYGPYMAHVWLISQINHVKSTMTWGYYMILLEIIPFVEDCGDDFLIFLVDTWGWSC